MEDKGIHFSIVKMFVVAALFVSFAGFAGCDALGMVNISVEFLDNFATYFLDNPILENPAL